MNTQATRVAIVGGGCAGLTAAFELTQADLRGQYEVTVYQMGWRLGGKGASSRGPFDRIEEHGIHLWMGCYENAFRMIREVYAENATRRGDSPLRTWRDAFRPISHLGLGRWSEAEGWDLWSAYFPSQPGLPGDPITPSPDGRDPFSIQGYLVRATSMLLTLTEHALSSPPRSGARTEAEQNTWNDPANLVERMRNVVLQGAAALRSPTMLAEAIRVLQAALGAELPAGIPLLAPLSRLIADASSTVVQRHTPRERDAMSVSEVAELIAVSIHGCLRDGVLQSPEGFESIDDHDFRDWLAHHGASERCLNSPFVRGIYSLTFAYEDGDTARPRMAAGVFLRVCVRMFFTYRGALFWRMAAGMGEIIFSPLYEVLRARGVKFEFFHRLRNVALEPGDDTGTSRVQSLEFDVQARTTTGEEYAPLIDVDGVPCWPDEPLWAQLDTAPAQRGHAAFEAASCNVIAERRHVRAGQDFDLVVLGIGVAALPSTCTELLARHPRWRTMTEQVKTVATQAFQLWLSPTVDQLGWDRGPVMSTAFAPPFDSWGDMSDLIAWEAWPGSHAPGSLGYFCNVMPDADIVTPFSVEGDQQSMRTVRNKVIHYLDHEIGALWPSAMHPEGGFRWDFVVGPETPNAEHPVDTQYIRANFNPSDRYTLSLPGSGRTRISALDRDCENLTVAGDWTACGIDVGCIEAAVMSGMLAAHATTGDTPRCEDIVGYHHP